jgi:hypothetical protein
MPGSPTCSATSEAPLLRRIVRCQHMSSRRRPLLVPRTPWRMTAWSSLSRPAPTADTSYPRRLQGSGRRVRAGSQANRRRASSTRAGKADDRSREDHQVPHWLPEARGGPPHPATRAGIDVRAAPASNVVACERGHGPSLRNFGCSELGDRLTMTWTRRAPGPSTQADLGHDPTVRSRAPWTHRPWVRKATTPSVLRTGTVGTATSGPVAHVVAHLSVKPAEPAPADRL